MELDFVCQHTLDYPAYWITISKRLSSTESLDRKFALLQIQSLSQSFNRTTSPHLLDKISLQIEKCTFDEISSIRSLSCLLLSKIISLQKTPRRSAFNAIISGLISVFPADLDSLLQTDPSCFHKFQYTPSHILHARINLIHALSGLFYCFEYLSPDIFCYIDTLFVALLNPQTNPLLQTAVIQSISSFPKTNRSRLRVEKYFRLLIFALVKSDKGQQEKQAPFHLQKAISKFASIWFPKSLDVNLIRINKTESQLDRLGNGYSKRRLEWLTKNESSKIKNLAPIKLPYTARSRAVLNPLDFSYGLQHYAHKRHAGYVEAENLDEFYFDSSIITPESIYEVSDPSIATFNESYQLVLTQTPTRKEIFLQNKSLFNDYSFFIQAVSNGSLISVEPSFGTVSRGETISIIAKSIASPDFDCSTIDGFLRLRSSDGFCSERFHTINSRLAIKTYNSPSIVVTPSTLDFQRCPLGESRFMILHISNILDTECSFAMFPLKKNSQFLITESQFVLSAKEQKFLTIKFIPNIEHDTTEKFVIVSFGGFLQFIKLKGCSIEPLTVFDSLIDFGPVNILYQGFSKKILIGNRDLRNKIHVCFSSSTNEISINNNNRVVLDPGETRKIQVFFKSNINGQRSEKIFVSADNSRIKEIDITAFSGPVASIGLFEELFLPISNNNELSLIFPICNMNATPIALIISFPKNSSFVLSMQSVEVLSNRRLSTAAGSNLPESKPYNSETSAGLHLTLPPKVASNVIIKMKDNTAGLFRSQLSVQLIKPRKYLIGTYNINSAVVNGAVLVLNNSIDSIRMFLNKPQEMKISDFSTFNTLANSVIPPSQNSLNFKVFALNVSFLIIQIDSIETKIVTLTNTSTDQQVYNILLSYPFFTFESLVGDIAPGDSINIPIKLNQKVFETVETDKSYSTCVGSFAVYDQEHYNILQIPLYGVYKNMISLEVRENTNEICFGRKKILEMSSHRFILKNNVPFPLVWEGRLSSITNNKSVKSNASGKEWIPFSLSTARLALKPYEINQFDIHFQANLAGEYMAGFNMDYVVVDDNKNSNENMKFDLRGVDLIGSVGAPDLTMSPDSLVFGDVIIGNQLTMTLIISNSQRLYVEFTLYSTCPDLFFQENFILNSDKTRIEIPIKFVPGDVRNYCEILSVSFNGITKNISIIATGRRPNSLTSNFGDFEIVKVSENNSPQQYDFGIINLHQPRTRRLEIQNKSPFDYYIKKISCTDPQVLSWVVDSNSNIPSLVNFDQENLDDEEIDWDEIDFKMGVPLKSTPNSASSPLKKKLVKTPINADKVTVTYPIRIPPFKSLNVNLTLGRNIPGPVSSGFQIDIPRNDLQTDSLRIFFKGVVQAALHVWDRKIEFGIKPAFERHNEELKFSNSGTLPISWRLITESTRIVPLAKFLDQEKASVANSDLLTVFPKTGILNPGCTQSIDVTITPNTPQHEVFCALKLISGDYAETTINAHVIGASAKLILEKTSLNFGVMRLGTVKVIKVNLRNAGILRARYFIECPNKQFSADPEQGFIEGSGSFDISIKFSPKINGNFNGMIRILAKSGDSLDMDPIFIDIQGIGSYPELVVLTKVLDFGTALLGVRNILSFLVENKGSAEANIIFDCHHKGISLESGSNLTIPPNSKQPLQVIYQPSVVEVLDAKMLLKSSDSRGDFFLIRLKGIVGVPKLTLDPPNIFENLDFGVCQNLIVHEKLFKMTNDGNIPLNYTGKLKLNFVKAIAYSSSKNNFEYEAISVNPLRASLAVGESVIVKVIFVPSTISHYSFQYDVNFDFKNLSIEIKGTGGQSILNIETKKLDFGICRLDRIFRKNLTLFNSGNLSANFILRPEPKNKDWSIYSHEVASLSQITTDEKKLKIKVSEKPSDYEEEITKYWNSLVSDAGLCVPQSPIRCDPGSKADAVINYNPKTKNPFNLKFRVFAENGYYEECDFSGFAETPKICIYSSISAKDAQGSWLIAGSHLSHNEKGEIDLGVRAVNSSSITIIQLVNEGNFGCDFLIQPIILKEFSVYPMRGFVASGSTIPLKIYFTPGSEERFQTTFKLLWEGAPLKIGLTGFGGLGKLFLLFSDEADEISKSLDFGDVPFQTNQERRWFIYNTGMVPVSISADVDHDEYNLSQIGEPFLWEDGKSISLRKELKKTPWNWSTKFHTKIPPMNCVEIGAKLFTNSPIMSTGTISIKSECNEFFIPVRGKGGSVIIEHKGDLSLGEIASSFTYSRQITITNSGSIASTMDFVWLVMGRSESEISSYVQLEETFSALDPRGGWAKGIVLKERAVATGSPITSREYWQIIRRSVVRSSQSKFVGFRSDIRLPKVWEDALDKVLESIKSKNSAEDKIHHRRTSSNIRKTPVAHQGQNTSFYKRRQMLYHLITNTVVSSQSSSRSASFISVSPSSATLPKFGEVNLKIDINLSTEETFLATLLVRSTIHNVPTYEIPLTAQPMAVHIVCSDTGILNFNRQPIGESEVMSRTFSNVGHKDIRFVIQNTNSSLSIEPDAGNLKVGETVSVIFTFTARNENIEQNDILFEPDCSQPIRIRFYGGGGTVKCSLGKYKRFDFGQCMIAKDTISYLPIINEGTACIHLTTFDLEESVTFFKGSNWPVKRITLAQNEKFNLPVVFNPKEETPPTGKVNVGTNAETWEIELVGLGREAVLIVSKVALEYKDCLIGNAYEQRLGLKNVGDVNYPLTITLDKEHADLSFSPATLVLAPFNDGSLNILYTPTRQTKTSVVLIISSPYSVNKIPITLHSGTANLEFSPMDTLEFGMFEKMTKPQMTLKIKNAGTCPTSFTVKDITKPSKFTVTNNKGVLTPGKTVEVIVTFVRHEIGTFKEILAVRTDLINKIYEIFATGRCEEAVVHPAEINFLKLGVCPILEPTTVPLQIRNYGYFPLSYSIKSAYPLKVSPTSGSIDGETTGQLFVSWTPSGSYELRTQMVISSNIGNLNVTVHGKSCFPELAVKSSTIDFGVCAVGHIYKEMGTIQNKGRVPLFYSISPPKETCFIVGRSSGTLLPKQEHDFSVAFSPTGQGRFTTGVVIECKGINYKEIIVSGVGAILKVDISPRNIDLGRCSFNQSISNIITIKNSGDVTICASFQYGEQRGYDSEITFPDPIEVRPHTTIRCAYSIKVKKIGLFSTQMSIVTKEKVYSIPIYGTGIKIELSDKAIDLLSSEKLNSMKLVNPLYGWYYHSDISIDQVAYRFYSPRFYNDQLISRVLGEWLASFVALKFEPALRIQGYSENDEQADKLLNEFAEDEENPGLENLKSRRSSLASTGFNSAYSSNQSLAFETLIIHSRNSSLDNSHSRISVSHSRRASIFVERAFVANLGNPIQEEAALVSKNSESNFVELPEPTGSELDFFARKSLIEVNQESSPSVLEPSVENGDIAQGNEKIGTSETNNDDLITSRSIELPESTSTAEEKTIEDKKLKELRPINLGRYTYDSKKVVTAIEEDENESIEAEEAISKSLPSLAGGLKPIKESQENTLHGSNNSSIQSHQSNMTSTEDIKVSVAEDKAIKKSAEELASIGQEDEIAIHLTSENAESGNDDVNVVKSIKSDNEMHQVNEAIPVQEIAHFSDNLVTSIGEIIESLIDVAVSTKLNDIELQNDSKGDVKDSIEEVEESTKSSQVSEESTKSSKVITDEIIAENVSEVKETLPELATISSSLNRDISSAEHSISKKSDVKNSNDEILITEIEKKSSYHEIVSETGPIKSKLDESKKELNQNAKDLVDDLRPNSSNVFINSIVDGLINEIAKEEQVKQEIAESGSFDTENPAIDDTDDIEITKEEEEQVDTKGSLEHLIDKTETIKPLTAKKIQPVELLDPKKTYESLLNIVKSEKPELEIIQKMALQFIELKVQTAPELTFYNDQEAIHNVISHAYPKTNHDYISLVLKSSFPELEVDLDVITQRPPPFPEFIKESYSVYESDARFNEWPKFKRKDRNSKASGFWNDETGFRVGQGVLSYYR